MFCLVYVFAYFMFCCLITNRELYNNRISSLPSDVFKDLYSIRDLFIEHNSISSIPLKTFRSTHNMEFCKSFTMYCTIRCRFKPLIHVWVYISARNMQRNLLRCNVRRKVNLLRQYSSVGIYFKNAQTVLHQSDKNK